VVYIGRVEAQRGIGTLREAAALSGRGLSLALDDLRRRGLIWSCSGSAPAPWGWRLPRSCSGTCLETRPALSEIASHVGSYRTGEAKHCKTPPGPNSCSIHGCRDSPWCDVGRGPLKRMWRPADVAWCTERDAAEHGAAHPEAYEMRTVRPRAAMRGRAASPDEPYHWGARC